MARLPVIVGVGVLAFGWAAVLIGAVPWERDPFEPGPRPDELVLVTCFALGAALAAGALVRRRPLRAAGAVAVWAGGLAVFFL